jgi:Right handed beta helix region
VFVGEPGAVLSGAKSIGSRFRPSSGRTWTATGQTQQNAQVTGRCESGAACRYAEDVYLDGRPLRRVLRRAEVRPGSFFFDYDDDVVVLGDSPGGRRVEAAVVTRAFEGWGGSARRVRITGLVVERFANEAQTGAINARADWVVDGNEVRFNHGIGIHGAKRVVGNRVHHNGQLGIGGDGGRGALVARNEIHHNNYAGFDPSWEAGGAKWVKTVQLTVQDNRVHNNAGPGLWTDTDNVRTVFVENRVADNAGPGIVHETSYEAVIARNVVLRNGVRVPGWVDGAGILVHSSAPVAVHHNRIVDNGDGIGLVQTDRGSGRYGPHVLRDVWVHDNEIVMPRGSTGLVTDTDDPSLYTSRNNRFERNTYVLGCNRSPFAWARSPGAGSFAYIGKEAWLAAGNDRGGRFEVRCRGKDGRR